MRRRAAIALACAIQLLPLAGPVLLSTDVYTYWDYARISTEHGGNPYVDVPNDYPDDPAFPLMGSHWRDTTSVYGPGFTLASEGHAAVVGDSPDAAAWLYRALAAAAMVALVLLAARLSPQPAFAAAFVGWNPLLAVHFAGGGHNDAWMMALRARRARARRRRGGGPGGRRLGGGDRDQVGAAPLPAAAVPRGAEDRPHASTTAASPRPLW